MKKTIRKPLFSVACVCLIGILFLTSCGATKKYEKLSWPSDGLAIMLPKIEGKLGEVFYNTNQSFAACVYKTKEDEATSYIEQCINLGFDVDVERTGVNYDGYNKEGYRLKIFYSDNQYSPQEMSINLNAPIEMSSLEWPSKGLAASLPEPKSKLGFIEYDSDEYVSIYVGETSKDQFNEYVEECKKAGFNSENSMFLDSYFYGSNKQKYELMISYERFNTMSISISHYSWNDDVTSEEETTTKKKEKETQEPTTKGTTTKETVTTVPETTTAVTHDYSAYPTDLQDFISRCEKYATKNISSSFVNDYTFHSSWASAWTSDYTIVISELRDAVPYVDPGVECSMDMLFTNKQGKSMTFTFTNEYGGQLKLKYVYKEENGSLPYKSPLGNE